MRFGSAARGFGQVVPLRSTKEGLRLRKEQFEWTEVVSNAGRSCCVARLGWEGCESLARSMHWALKSASNIKSRGRVPAA